MNDFDPYHKWLAIPPNEQPPHHYRLLGVALFESDLDVIEAAADRQMAYIRQCATGPYIKQSQQILNELSAARVCLLNPAKRQAYDKELKTRLAPATPSPEPKTRDARPRVTRIPADRQPTDDTDDGGQYPLIVLERSSAEGHISLPRRGRSKKTARPNTYWLWGGAGGLGLFLLWGFIHLISQPGSDATSGRPQEQAPQSTKDQPAVAKHKRDAGDAGRGKAEPEKSEHSVVAAESPLTVLAAEYGTATQRVDLKERLQKAADAGLLVVFVEQELSGGTTVGDLSLRLQLGNKITDQRFGHRQFVFVDAREPPRIPQQGLAILDAFYGTGIWTEGKMVDVKKLVNALVKDDRVRVPVREIASKFSDPAFGQSKVLIVRFALDGHIETVMFEEHQTVELGQVERH